MDFIISNEILNEQYINVISNKTRFIVHIHRRFSSECFAERNIRVGCVIATSVIEPNDKMFGAVEEVSYSDSGGRVPIPVKTVLHRFSHTSRRGEYDATNRSPHRKSQVLLHEDTASPTETMAFISTQPVVLAQESHPVERYITSCVVQPEH